MTQAGKRYPSYDKKHREMRARRDAEADAHRAASNATAGPTHADACIEYAVKGECEHGTAAATPLDGYPAHSWQPTSASRPWRVEHHDEESELIGFDVDGNECLIARGLTPEDATLIFTAVNSYAAMREALRGEINEYGHTESCGRSSPPDPNRPCRERCEKIRAALANQPCTSEDDGDPSEPGHPSNPRSEY